MKPLPTAHLPPPRHDPSKQARWGATSIVELSGPYSSFLAKKVAKVFRDVVPEELEGSLTATRKPSTRFAIEKIPVGARRQTEALVKSLSAARSAPSRHPVLSSLTDAEALRCFMVGRRSTQIDFVRFFFFFARRQLCACGLLLFFSCLGNIFLSGT